MGLFSRWGKKKQAELTEGGVSPTDADSVVQEDGALSRDSESQSEAFSGEADQGVTADSDVIFDRSNGPYDSSEVDDLTSYIDAGSVLLPTPSEGEVRFSVDPRSGKVLGILYMVKDSVLQIQPFAAPKSSDLWGEILSQMHATIAQHGGRAKLVDGPLGQELRAFVPQQQPDGTVVAVPHRFVGVNGPRWMLQLAIYGAAVNDDSIAASLYDYARHIVVHRGSEPHPPSELLTIKVPQAAEEDGASQHLPQQAAGKHAATPRN
ncbi:MAG: DUF3710 domain-containing protein [Actinomycetaceae bacterium]|nr:DUF3710 domain-containing protein [Actinomycetaceae bacterium]